MVRRFFTYVAIALAFLALFVAVLALSIHTGIAIESRWAALATFTGFLVVVMIKTYRRHWARPAFWFIGVAMLCIHLMAFIVLLRSYPGFRPVWYLPIVVAEAGAFGMLCDWLLTPLNRK